MSDHFTTDELRRFLDGDSAVDQAAVDRHVENCAECQERLARLLDEAPAVAGPAPLAAPALPDDLIDQLKHACPAPEPEWPDLGPPGAQVLEGRRGRYRILRALGRSRVLATFLAREDVVERLVAIKFLEPRLAQDPRGRQAFEAAQRPLERESDPTLVAVDDTNRPGDPLVFLVREHVSGESLAERLRRDGPLSAIEAARLLHQLAVALTPLHRRGLAHLNLKAANVVVQHRGGRIRLTDPGLAVPGGTPAYLAPEQLQPGRRPSPRTDVHALGVLLYEMLTGERPFRGVTHSDIARQRLNRDPIPPSQLNGSLPDALEAICLRCLERSPAHRYPCATALAEDLHRFLGENPVHARGGRFTRFRRRLGQAFATGWMSRVILAVLLLGGLTATLLCWAALRGRQAAEQHAHTAEALAARTAQSTGQLLCAAGQSSAGLPWLARALELAPPTEPRLEHTLRRQIGLWMQGDRPPLAVSHDAAITLTVFSPDGQTLLTGSAEGTARLWQTASGTPRTLLLTHPAPVIAGAFASDGSLLTACRQQLRRWSLDGKPLGRPVSLPDGAVHVTLSPGGRSVLVLRADRTALLLDSQGQTIGRPLRHEARLTAGLFIAGGRRILTASADGIVRVWRADDGESVGPALTHSGPVDHLIASPDGALVLTARGREAILWNAASGEKLATLEHTAGVRALAFLPDGRTLATGAGRFVQVWRTNGAKVGTPIEVAMDVRSLAVARDGLLASLDEAGNGRMWDPESGVAVGPVLKHGLASGVLTFDADGRMLAVSGMEGPRGRVLLWSLPCPEGTPARLACWVALRTGNQVDAQGVLQPLDPAEKERLQVRLTALGGVPVP